MSHLDSNCWEFKRLPASHDVISVGIDQALNGCADTFRRPISKAWFLTRFTVAKRRRMYRRRCTEFIIDRVLFLFRFTLLNEFESESIICFFEIFMRLQVFFFLSFGRKDFSVERCGTTSDNFLRYKCWSASRSLSPKKWCQVARKPCDTKFVHQPCHHETEFSNFSVHVFQLQETIPWLYP